MAMEWQWGQFNHKAMLKHLRFDLSLGISYVLMNACLVTDHMCRCGEIWKHKTWCPLSNNNSKMLFNKLTADRQTIFHVIWKIVYWVSCTWKYSYIKYECSKLKIQKKQIRYLFFLLRFYHCKILSHYFYLPDSGKFKV